MSFPVREFIPDIPEPLIWCQFITLLSMNSSTSCQPTLCLLRTWCRSDLFSYTHRSISAESQQAHCLLLSTTHKNYKQWMHLGSVCSLWPLMQILIGRVRSQLYYFYFALKLCWLWESIYFFSVWEPLQACCPIVHILCVLLNYFGDNKPQYSRVR